MPKSKPLGIIALLLLLVIVVTAQVVTQPPGGGGGGATGVTSVATGCGLSGGPITTTGTVTQAIATAAHNGSYAILAGDCGKSLTTNTTAAWTIAQAGTAGFAAGTFWIVQNVGSGSLTLTATSSTFYGGPTANISGSALTVPTNTSATVVSDGSNFQVLSGGGSGGSVFPITVSGTVNSGGIPCFNSTTNEQTSVTLAANAIVIGGGAGACPTGVTAIPNGTTATTQSQNDNSTKPATTAYADLAVANAIAGVNPAIAVVAASTASLTGTYSNGVAGIGATFTVTATGVFSLDGVAINTIGQRILLKDQSSGFQNGIYAATVLGALAVSPIFTRALDYDAPSDINSTGAIPVQSGTVNTTTSWLLTSTVNTVGTDALTYVKFSINPASLPTGSVFINATGCGSNTCVATPSPAITTYANLTINMKIDAPNTSDTTVNVSGLGAKHVYYGGSVLTANGLNSTAFVYTLVYDGTNLNCINCGNGFTYSYLRPISQNTLATAPFSIASTNYNISNSVQGSNAGLIAQTASAWTFGTTPLPKNTTAALANVYDFQVPLPPSWIASSGLTFQVIWMLPSGSSATGNLLLRVRGQTVCSGAALGSYTAPLSFTASTAAAASVQTYTGALTASTSDVLTGATAGCLFYGQLFRDGTQGGDTLNDPNNAPTTDAQLVMLIIGTPGGAGGTVGAVGGTGPAGPSGTVGITAGTSVSLTSAVGQIFVCTSTCTVTPPVPANGAQYCVYNDDNVSTVITMAAVGSSVQYENAARTAYGTAGTGTLVSGVGIGNRVCIVFRDSTHYSTVSYNGTWTAN